MTCCGKTIRKGKNIVKGVVTKALGIKYEFSDGRIAICRGCPDNFWTGKVIWCKICKCCVPLKANVEDEKCPKGKWDK